MSADCEGPSLLGSVAEVIWSKGPELESGKWRGMRRFFWRSELPLPSILRIHIYQLEVETLLRVALTIAGGQIRSRFFILVGEELNDRITQLAHKLAWQELLSSL